MAVAGLAPSFDLCILPFVILVELVMQIDRVPPTKSMERTYDWLVAKVRAILASPRLAIDICDDWGRKPPVEGIDLQLFRVGKSPHGRGRSLLTCEKACAWGHADGAATRGSTQSGYVPKRTRSFGGVCRLYSIVGRSGVLSGGLSHRLGSRPARAVAI